MTSPPPPLPDTYWLLEGRLLAGSYAGGWTPQATKEKLARFLDAGIRSFIDLTEEHDPLPPYAHVLHTLAEERGIHVRYRRLAIRDLDVPTAELMAEIIGVIRAELDEGRAVYFHCWGGVGRTGTVAGCWLVESGMTPDAALDLVAARRWSTPSETLRSPETDEQRAFVVAWKQA